MSGSAHALLPQGNQLTDGDAESPPTCSLEHWSCSGNHATEVRYGTPGGFPSLVESQRIGGGNYFFAGGPDSSGGTIYQGVDLRQAQPEVDASAAVVTLSACLGGYDSQGDDATLSMRYFNEGGTSYKDSAAVSTPDRGGQTKFLPAQVTEVIPPKMRSLLANVSFSRTDPAYDDGYADNVSVRLTPVGTVPPAPDCTGKSGGGGGGGSGGGKGGSSGGTPLLSKIGSTAVLSHGRIVVRLRCLAHDARCKGRLSASVGRLPAASSSAVTLGSARFSIKAGRTGKVKVKLRRRARRRLGALSRRRLRRVKVTVRTKVGSTPSKFTLRLRR